MKQQEYQCVQCGKTVTIRYWNRYNRERGYCADTPIPCPNCDHIDWKTARDI